MSRVVDGGPGDGPVACATLGVVIPCRNEVGTIAHVLDALAAQERRPDEVVVVDDGSTDGTGAVVERWSSREPILKVRVLANLAHGATGIPAAVNAGIRVLTTDVIARLDGHCLPAPDYLRRLIGLAVRPEVGVSGGAWVIVPGASTSVARAVALAAGHPFGSGGAAYRHPGETGPFDTDTVPFGCFRRQVWESVGGYDESLGANEDYEFNWRVRRSGQRVVLDPSACCTYFARATLSSLARQYFRYGHWKATMLRRHPSSVRPRQIAPAALIVVLVGAAALALLLADARWLLPVAGYAAAVGLAGLLTRGGRLLMAAALAVMHLSWGLGFWVSMARSLGGR